MSSVTSKETFFRLLKFSKKAFETTMKASANCDRIVFCLCQIDLSSDIDLSGPEYRTTYLSLWRIGDQKENDWKNHPERLKRVIKAISLCSLKDSLKTLNVRKSDVAVKTVQEMLKEFKLDGIQVIEDLIYALNE